MISSKRLRQGQILKMVEESEIGSQDDLRRLLRQKGIRVTQATLSRDLQELGLAKTVEGYRVLESGAGEAAPQLRLEQALRQFLLDVRAAQNLLVLKTPPGGAQPLAVALDRGRWEEVVGTIGGDDTVLVVTPSARGRAALEKKIQGLLR